MRDNEIPHVQSSVRPIRPDPYTSDDEHVEIALRTYGHEQRLILNLRDAIDLARSLYIVIGELEKRTGGTDERLTQSLQLRDPTPGELQRLVDDLRKMR